MTVQLKIEGMMCEHCKVRVQNALQAVAGVSHVDVDLKNKTASVTGNADELALKAAVIDAGYTVID